MEGFQVVQHAQCVIRRMEYGGQNDQRAQVIVDLLHLDAWKRIAMGARGEETADAESGDSQQDGQHEQRVPCIEKKRNADDGEDPCGKSTDRPGICKQQASRQRSADAHAAEEGKDACGLEQVIADVLFKGMGLCIAAQGERMLRNAGRRYTEQSGQALRAQTELQTGLGGHARTIES